MTVTITKPQATLRELLAGLKKRTGLFGEQIIRAENAADFYNVIGQNRNRIINGAMQIDQRNAGSSVTPASGAYTLDRWQYGASQASKVTIQQNAGSVTPPAGFKNYLGAVVASTATVGAGDYFQFSQKIEANNTSDLDWGLSTGKPLTLSFWARCSGAVTLSGAVQSILSPYPSYPFTFSFTASGIWQQFVITIPAPPPSTNWDTGISTSLYIQWNLACGSTYSGPANAWVNSNYFGATGASSLMGTVGNYLYITGVQLERGNIATPFEYRPIGTELALCQRYYFPITLPQDTNIAYPAVVYGNTTLLMMALPVNISMRANPTVTTFIGTAYPQAYRYDGGSNVSQALTNFSVSGRSTNGVYWFELQLQGGSSWGAATSHVNVGWTGGTNSKIFLSAEL